MSQTPITVNYTIEEIFEEIKQSIKDVSQKLDALQKDVTELKVGQAELKAKVENIEKGLEKVEGTQKNQIWVLITLLGGSLIAVGFRAFYLN